MGSASHAALRVATPADIAEIQRVRRSVRENALSDSTIITDAMVREHLCDIGRGWVAEMDGRIVGFAIANLRDASIWALFVEPGCERRGVGRALHDAMMEWLQAQGLRTVRLTTGPGTRAEGFYRAAGWQAQGLDATGELVMTFAGRRGTGCTLRPTTPADVPEILRVREAAMEHAAAAGLMPPFARSPKPRSDVDGVLGWDWNLDPGLELGWVAEWDGSVVGFAIADEFDPNSWAVFVERDDERLGIRRALHDRMMHRLGHTAARLVFVTTDPGAAEFYRRAGWIPWGHDAHGGTQHRYTLREAPSQAEEADPDNDHDDDDPGTPFTRRASRSTAFAAAMAGMFAGLFTTYAAAIWRFGRASLETTLATAPVAVVPSFFLVGLPVSMLLAQAAPHRAWPAHFGAAGLAGAILAPVLVGCLAATLVGGEGALLLGAAPVVAVWCVALTRSREAQRPLRTWQRKRSSP